MLSKRVAFNIIMAHFIVEKLGIHIKNVRTFYLQNSTKSSRVRTLSVKSHRVGQPKTQKFFDSILNMHSCQLRCADHFSYV